ncbi:hypothetical protein CEP52_004457 [Fusarium oligoseptatum]|uniref:GPI inositol-deacylase winged helix domain-containing protein n=1 Tax=Fusarium oligoseptatum TaxID=2604345 RepID=A0A428U395_9HYPO|nr:hypothetical protein CEP52_004457 [Fusarium oligoseptatum]
MSFGFGVGDFIAVLELVNKVRKDFQSAPSQFEDISNQVRSLSIVLSDVDVTVSELELDPYQRNDLQHVISSCRDVLERLEDTLDKYRDLHADKGRLGSRVKRAWKRLNWEPDDIRELRERITLNTTLLNTFLGGISSQTMFIPDIVDTFEIGTALEIRASNEDVERYVKGRIDHLQPFVRRNKQLQEEIKVGISTAVDGMFLLAQIFLDSLDDKLTPKSIRNGLKDFRKQSQRPGEDAKSQALDYAYQQAMERINNQKPGLREIALQVLAWITCAKRPLTQLELQYALAVELDTLQLDEENLPDIQGTVSACCGLVTIDNESNIIRLVHYTTQEYFERTQAKWFPNAEAEITMVCLTYLSFKAFEAGSCRLIEELMERLRSNPLYDYAAQHWGHHARRASAVTEEIIEFLESNWKVEAAGQALLCSERDRPGSRALGQADPGDATGLHLAAYFDLEVVMKSLLERGSIDPNSAASFKFWEDMTPLSYAAQMGHEAIVKLLLEKDNVDPDAKNTAYRNFGRTPLSYAAENGYESIVELLINTGRVVVDDPRTGVDFDMYSHPSDGLTSLCAAVDHGHCGVVKILLAAGADPAFKLLDRYRGEETDTPLARATKSGHEAIAKLLLEKIESNAKSEKQRD